MVISVEIQLNVKKKNMRTMCLALNFSNQQQLLKPQTKGYVNIADERIERGRKIGWEKVGYGKGKFVGLDREG